MLKQLMSDKNLSALLFNVDILFYGLGVLVPDWLIEFKDNITVSTVWNTGETGDIDNLVFVFTIVNFWKIRYSLT